MILNCDTITNENGQEIKKHGTLLFPVAAYHDDLNNNSVAWHWHDEFEAVFVSEGSGVVGINSQKISLTEGEGIFINSGVLHSAYRTGKNFEVNSLVFHSNLITGGEFNVFQEKYMALLTRNSKYFHLQKNIPWQNLCIENFIKAWKFYEQEIFGYEFHVREELSRFLLTLLENIPEAPEISPAEQRATERIKIMLNYIREHFAKTLTTKDIAASASISESECLRCFHRILNTTPMQYLKIYRLKKSESLLTSAADMSISDIASVCGFDDVSYFAKIFRVKNGITPSQYRLTCPPLVIST